MNTLISSLDLHMRTVSYVDLKKTSNDGYLSGIPYKKIFHLLIYVFTYCFNLYRICITFLIKNNMDVSILKLKIKVV